MAKRGDEVPVSAGPPEPTGETSQTRNPDPHHARYGEAGRLFGTPGRASRRGRFGCETGLRKHSVTRLSRLAFANRTVSSLNAEPRGKDERRTATGEMQKAALLQKAAARRRWRAKGIFLFFFSFPA